MPVALRMKVRYREVDTFISKYATNISRGGLFLSTAKPVAVGTELRFEIQLATGAPVVSGRGVVRWVRPFDPARPRAPHGMGVAFTELSDESRALLDDIVAERRRQGLGDNDAIPHAIPHANGKRPATAPPATAAAPARDADDPPALSAEALRRALERARELVGTGDRDPELADLGRLTPAETARSVDEASRSLAEMLGGEPVVARTRRRATRAAPELPPEPAAEESSDPADGEPPEEAFDDAAPTTFGSPALLEQLVGEGDADDDGS